MGTVHTPFLHQGRSTKSWEAAQPLGGGSGGSPYGQREAGVAAYPGDLDTVQLLLPVQNRLHPVYPHVDVPDQHRLADSLHQRAQGRVEGLQQLPDEPDVLLVFEDLSGGEQSMSSHDNGDTIHLVCGPFFSSVLLLSRGYCLWGCGFLSRCYLFDTWPSFDT